jgi:hypothetical protein
VGGWGGGGGGATKTKISRSARERKEPGFGISAARAFEGGGSLLNPVHRNAISRAGVGDHFRKSLRCRLEFVPRGSGPAKRGTPKDTLDFGRPPGPKTSPTQVEGSRGPNSDPKIRDFYAGNRPLKSPPASTTGGPPANKTPLPQRLASDLGPKFIIPRHPRTLALPHPDFEAPDAKTSKNPLKTNMH